MARYLKAANLSDLPPGSAKAVEVEGKAIALFNVDGKIYALAGWNQAFLATNQEATLSSC